MPDGKESDLGSAEQAYARRRRTFETDATGDEQLHLPYLEETCIEEVAIKRSVI